MRITEQDEFLLSRLLDGELDAAQADALRARVAREPVLRASFEAMGSLDRALMNRRTRQPDVDWAKFHQRIMTEIAAKQSRSTSIRIFKFPPPVWYAWAPLAAAAAIAFVV